MSTWEHFVSVTWIFFIFAWVMRFATWALCAGAYWINVSLSGSPDEIEKDN